MILSQNRNQDILRCVFPGAPLNSDIGVIKNTGASIGENQSCSTQYVYVLFRVFVPWQGTEWALNKKVKKGGQDLIIALGNQCALCYRKWQYFVDRFQSFEEWADAMEGDESLQQECVEAEKVSLGGPKTFPAEQMGEIVSVDFIIDRDFVVLNERELRQLTKATRIPKSSLAVLSSMKAPREDGVPGNEDVYLFYDPEKPFRRGTLRVAHSMSATKSWLPDAKHVWPGQSKHSLGRHVSDEMKDRVAALEKVRNNGKLYEVEEWRSKFFDEGDGDADGALAKGAGTESDGEEMAGEATFSGPAAPQVELRSNLAESGGQTYFTPKKKDGKAGRSSSSVAPGCDRASAVAGDGGSGGPGDDQAGSEEEGPSAVKSI